MTNADQALEALKKRGAELLTATATEPTKETPNTYMNVVAKLSRADGQLMLDTVKILEEALYGQENK